MTAVAEVEITARHRVLAVYLERRCRGRPAARPKRRILADLAASGCRLDPREFDRFAGDLARSRRYRVGSSDDGFFWMVEEEDFRLARGYLLARFAPMRDRIEAIEAMHAAAFPPGSGTMLFDIYGGWQGAADNG